MKPHIRAFWDGMIVGAAIMGLVMYLTACTTPTAPAPCPTVKEYQNDTTITKDSCVTGVRGGIEGVAR